MLQANNSVILTRIEAFYGLLLIFYPADYRKRFGDQMVLVFHDMYKEEIKKNGKIGYTFWLMLIHDVLQSAIDQHVQEAQKYGIKKYVQKTLHVTKYSVIGFILLIPFLLVMSIDSVVVLLTGSRVALAGMYQSVFWNFSILPIWLLGFPVLALLLNAIPLIKTLQKEKYTFHGSLIVKENLAASGIIAIGFFAVFMVFGHDFVPCVFNHIISIGIIFIPQIFDICKKA